MTMNSRGYYDYDINIEEAVVKDGCMEELLYFKDLKQRKLFLNDEIEEYSVAEIVKHILQYNAEDKGKEPNERTPILLYVTSNGGDVDAGFKLIDAIKCSKTPVYTINLGYQYSMGFLVGLAGHKRYATENAKFLMHDGSNFVFNSGAKVQDQMEFQRRVEERIKRYILTNSKLTPEEYDSKFRIEWYLFADEAKEKGFVDYIIGVDCDIDAVI